MSQQTKLDHLPNEVKKYNLFEYVAHWHTPVNVNDLHLRSLSSFNDKIALTITSWLGSMWAAYIFVILAILGFPGLHAALPQYVSWLSQTFVQLVALAILGNGQKIAEGHAHLQAEEQFNFTEKSYFDVEQIKEHLLRIEAKLEGGGNSNAQATTSAQPETNPTA